MKKPTDICLVIRSLHRGGTERQLALLGTKLKDRGLNVLIVTFYPGGAIGADLAAKEIPVVSLDKRGRWDVLGFFVRLVGVLRSARPRVMYAFLSGANLACLAARPFMPKTTLVWGMRGSKRNMRGYDWVIRSTRHAQSFLAFFVDVVIFNSEAGRRHYAARGFPRSKLVVVPNGIDAERFRPDSGARSRVREEWGLSPGTLVYGVVGYFEPVKGQSLFLEAASRLASNDACFVCVGRGSPETEANLRLRADRLGIAGRVHFVPESEDIAGVYNALDIVVSASESEGFPNVVGEAMACGVPCVVTDVGDSATIVGDTGVVVRSPTAEKLARAMGTIARSLAESPADTKNRARQRIVDLFDPERLTVGTLEALAPFLRVGAGFGGDVPN